MVSQKPIAMCNQPAVARLVGIRVGNGSRVVDVVKDAE